MNAENTQAIKEYSQTEAALAELRTKFQGVVFEVTTTTGDKAAREARQTLVKLRTALEAKRKEIKAPALAHAKAIDIEAARITAAIRALEEPIDQQIKAEEERKAAEKAEKERIERERVDGIKAKIDAIRNLPVASSNDAAAELGSTLADLQAFEVSVEVFAEFTVEAASVQGQTIDTLKRMHAQAVAREEEAARAAAERAELERQRREQEEREALARAAQEEEARKLAAEREAFEREKAEAAAKEQAARDEEARKLEAERAELARQKAEFEAQQRAQAEAAERKAEEERRAEQAQRERDQVSKRAQAEVANLMRADLTDDRHTLADDAQRAVDYAEAPAPQPESNVYSFQNMQPAPVTQAACPKHSWLLEQGQDGSMPCPECEQDKAVAETLAWPAPLTVSYSRDGGMAKSMLVIKYGTTASSDADAKENIRAHLKFIGITSAIVFEDGETRTYTAEEMRAAFIAGYKCDGFEPGTVLTDRDLEEAATLYVARLEG